MNVDPRSHIPIFRQIADGLSDQIAAGVYRSGEGLPSIRALALELRVNHNTVHRAYEVLEREGLIRQRRGIGMFVASRAGATARARVVNRSRNALREAVDRCLQASMEPGTILGVVNAALNAASAGRSAR